MNEFNLIAFENILGWKKINVDTKSINFELANESLGGLGLGLGLSPKMTFKIHKNSFNNFRQNTHESN
jgi:hypothetical protein